MGSAARDVSVQKELFARSCAAVKITAFVTLLARGASGFPASGSDGFVPRCSSGKFLYCRVVQDYENWRSAASGASARRSECEGAFLQQEGRRNPAVVDTE